MKWWRGVSGRSVSWFRWWYKRDVAGQVDWFNDSTGTIFGLLEIERCKYSRRKKDVCVSAVDERNSRWITIVQKSHHYIAFANMDSKRFSQWCQNIYLLLTKPNCIIAIIVIARFARSIVSISNLHDKWRCLRKRKRRPWWIWWRCQHHQYSTIRAVGVISNTMTMTIAMAVEITCTIIIITAIVIMIKLISILITIMIAIYVFTSITIFVCHLYLNQLNSI